MGRLVWKTVLKESHVINRLGKLYVVATPIGNLSDITQRAIIVLKEVDLIAAEDTRHSLRLLQHYQINTSMVSLHEYNEKTKYEKIVQKLLQGCSVALISDSGTPLISDPGYCLVRAAREHNVEIIPIPGACAAIAALSAAGLPTNKFVFEGFLPAKQQARLQCLKELKNEFRTIIFYESPHRIIMLLKDMLEVYGPERCVVLARELTKLHETIHGDSLLVLLNWLDVRKEQHCGEFVVLVAGLEKPDKQELSESDIKVLTVLLEELSIKQASHLAAKITKKKKNSLYKMALELSEEF